MNIRNDLMEAKKAELKTVITNTCSKVTKYDFHVEEIERTLLDCRCLTITPPQEEPAKMYMITLDSLTDYRKGSSIKPGNIRINIKHLIDSLPEIISASVSISVDIPILKICAALSIWKILRNLSTIEITKEDAIVIAALWKNCDNKHKIPVEEGFDKVNIICKGVSEKEFTWEQYIQVLDLLEKINSIKLDEDGIWLCEWVSRDYTK